MTKLKINRPDYQGKSLVNLMTSIGLAHGRPSQGYPACPTLTAEQLDDYDNLVLLVVDGLGFDYLDSTDGLYKQHCQDILTSVFPSTTASSITTFLTGLAPQQHGLTGWFTYLEEVGSVTAVLPCVIRGSQEKISDRGIDIGGLYDHPVFFDQLESPSVSVSPDWIRKTEFNQTHTGRASTRGYENMEDMFAQVTRAIKQSQGKQYIYAYWAEFDHLSHVHGNHSGIVSEHFQQLQKATEKFLIDIKASNTLLVITADHGFIDLTPEQRITVNDHQRMQECLRLPLSGEPRAAYCYLYQDRCEQFVDYVNNQFPDQLECIPSQELIDGNFYGLGEAHPQLHKRVGDYALLMKENFIIKDWLPTEKPFFHYGVHGGVSEREMFVPLIILPA